MWLSREVRLGRVPSGSLEIEDFEVVEVRLGPLEPGEVLVCNEWTSVDPVMRIRMRSQAPRGYFSAFGVGRPMGGVMSVGVVVESRHPDFQPGQRVTHGAGWRSRAVLRPGVDGSRTLDQVRLLPSAEVPVQWHLGPLGGIGLTAWVGLEELGAPSRSGSTMWISAAAGGVGTIATQLARLRGFTVIGSASGERKMAHLVEVLGVHHAIDRTAGSLEDELRQVCGQEGLEAYFDNVGGDHLAAALSNMAVRGRILLCGSVAEYDSGHGAVPSLFPVTSLELTIRGLRGSSHVHRLDEVRAELTPLLLDRSIVWDETVYEGLAAAPIALVDLLAGRTRGKVLVRLDRAE